MPRLLCLHAGTHKTASKLLQVFLSLNRDTLAARNVYVPRTGRVELEEHIFTPGHHAIAWELDRGEVALLSDAAREVAAADAAVAVLSSEDFHPLFAKPGAFEAVRDAFTQVGYTVVPLIYLRRQDEYAASLYGEYAKTARVPRPELYWARITAEAVYRPSPAAPPIVFDYPRLLDRFGDVFGEHNVIARAYHRSDDDDLMMLRDFLAILSLLSEHDVHADWYMPHTRVNERMTLRGLLARILTMYDAPETVDTFLQRFFPDVQSGDIDTAFRIRSYAECESLLQRLARSNNDVLERYHCDIPFRTSRDLHDPHDEWWLRAGLHRHILARAFAEYDR